MKKDFIMPILMLSLICLIISGALAVTNGVTEPIILAAAAERADHARHDIIPEAEEFIKLLTEDGEVPETVTEIYVSSNDVGYIFMITSGGYGGDIEIICGIDPEGRIIRCATLAHAETKGLGSKITEPFFKEQFMGKSAALEDISAITGATISSSAYIEAIRDAFIAFEIVRGLE